MARKSRKQNALKPIGMAEQEKNEKVYRTALYARLSVEDSKNPDCDTIENQMNLLREYVKDKPYLQVAEEFVDNGVTGTRFDRPGFSRMIGCMRKGDIDCIIVKDFSRLGRNYLEAGDYLEKIFPFFGVRFISVTDGYDSLLSEAAEDGLIVPLKNLINEAYAKDVSKKIETALAIKQRKGEFVGANAPYGYKKSPENKHRLIVDEEVRQVVVDIFEWKAAGMGYGAIARKLNEAGIPAPSRYRYLKGLTKNPRFENVLWGDSTIQCILTNPVYMGDMEQGITKRAIHKGISFQRVAKEDRPYVYNTHEPIVSRDLFGRVGSILEEGRRKCLAAKGKYNYLGMPENPYRSIMFCADCGGRMLLKRSVTKHKEKMYVWYGYVCPNSSSHGKLFCKEKNVTKDIIDGAVEASLRMQMDLFFEAQEAMRQMNQTRQAKREQEGYKKEIGLLHGRLEHTKSIAGGLYEDFADGVLNEKEYLLARKHYREEENCLEQLIAETEYKQSVYQGDFAETFDFAPKMEKYRNFDSLTPEIVQAFIKAVWVADSRHIEIEYTFKDELQAYLNILRQREGEAYVRHGR